MALKIIKPGMDTGEVVARFESERRAALRDHAALLRELGRGEEAAARGRS